MNGQNLIVGVGLGSRSRLLSFAKLSRIAAAITIGMATCHGYADTALQKFTVHVPESVATTTPATDIVNLELVAGSNTFPTQLWNVHSNADDGVIVDFALVGAFTHQTLADVNVDAQIGISIPATTGLANWEITQANATASVRENNEHAFVQAMSDGTGSAVIGLDLSFVESSLDVVPAGTYNTEVVCTITVP
ncbi:hypothetical protein N9N28_12490 [Rubripirellula amarantea]|nr:hypothetical protein [Rubripirellula amarantea]